MSEQHDVIVVGGGPVGLALALGLARDGVDVLVLEKDAATADHSRAPAIWPRTQEILADLGVIDRFAATGISLPRFQIWDADRARVLVSLPLEELRDETPYPSLLIVPQSTTERLLYEEIRDRTRAEVRFSSAAVGFEEDASGVDVRYVRDGTEARVRGRFVVGCDGAHSTMRHLLDGSLEGITYTLQAALADVTLRNDEPLPFPRLTTRPRLAIGIRIETRLWRLILPYFPGDARELDGRIDDAVRGLFPRKAYDIVWKSEFHLHRRVSSRWLAGRVVLAGDAAHLNSPVGGEGMNAGIIDASLLAKALRAALAADDSQPLQDYVDHRRAAITRGVNRFTDRLTRLLSLGHGSLVRSVFHAVRLLIHIGPLRRRILRRIALLDES